MSNAGDKTVNWEPYEAEIISLYIDQNQTLEATMTHMRDKYDLRATTRQYKTRFSGLKNMKASEWASVTHGVRKRALEGKDSDVYLHGKRLDPKRVKTQIARYESSIPDPNFETVIGTSSQDRIYIRTPPAASPSPGPSQASAAQRIRLDVNNDLFLDMDVDFDMDFGQLTRQTYQSSSPVFTEMSPRLGRFIIEDTNPQHISMLETHSFFENVDLDMLYYINVELELTRNLPWFQLQNIMEQPGFIYVTPVVNEIFRTSSRPSSPFSPFNFNGTNLDLEERHSLLSGFLTSNSKNQVGDFIPYFTTDLQKLIPERQEGELSKKVQKLFDPYNKHPLYQLFEIATYFSSNNILTKSQTDCFLKWVIHQRHTDQLKYFLQIKTPTIQAFSTRILESGIRIKNTKFLHLLLVSGFKFDGVLEQAMKIDDIQFITLLLHSGVESSLLSGASGGRLLHVIAKTSYTEVAQILINNGADVNLPTTEGNSTTSLHMAVSWSNVNMVKCLLRAGARVNMLCSTYFSTALAEAVYYSKTDMVVALLESGANVHIGRISGEAILEWAALYARNIYKILLQKTGRDDQYIAIGDIVYAAERGGRAFASFLRQNEARLSQMQLEKALNQSIMHEKFRATAALLQNGVDANGPSLDDDDRPLMIAALRGDIKYYQLLTNAGASANIPGLLERAVEQGNFELVDLLIEAGADLEIYGPEALETAAESDNFEIAALLIDKGTAVNAYGKTFTGLQAASSITFAQYLIERGADVNAPASAEGGRTALQAAAENYDFEMVTLLLDNRADVNAPPAQVDGLTALEAALIGYRSSQEKKKIFKLLLKNGALINRPGSLGRPDTILHSLIKENQEDLIRLAVDAGVNLESMSSGDSGRRPLQLAADIGNLGIVKLLLEHGADVNAPPGYKYGRTALQAAASCKTATMELIQLLIDSGADIHAPAAVTGGITALQGAAIRGHIKLALMLLKLGADVNARPAFNEGRTAIEGAAEHGRLDMVQLLLNAGAIGDVMWKTGFKRAITLAEKRRHFAIAELLRVQPEEE